MTPKKTRKFPTAKKTTTKEGKREYMRQYMREVAKRKKAHTEVDSLSKYWRRQWLDAVRQIPSYKMLTTDEQATVEREALEFSTYLSQQLDQTVNEFSLYLRAVTPDIIERAMNRVKEESKQQLEATLRKCFASIPDEQKQKALEKIVAWIEAKKFMAITVLCEQKAEK